MEGSKLEQIPKGLWGGKSFEPIVDKNHLNNCISLEMLFIAPEERGKGIGKQLLQYGFQNYGIYEMTVNEQNPQAVGNHKNMTANDISSGKLREKVFAFVSSAENSSIDYAEQYAYIEDIGDGRGYTAGIIG